MPDKLAPGTKVRFTADWLAQCALCSPADARRYQGRVGVIHGYRAGARAPIVLFPRDGRRPEQMLFEVDVRRLALVSAEESAAQ